jgi:hypothetical protein
VGCGMRDAGYEMRDVRPFSRTRLFAVLSSTRYEYEEEVRA